VSPLADSRHSRIDSRLLDGRRKTMTNTALDQRQLRNFRFDTKEVDWKDFITSGCYYKLLDVNVATSATWVRGTRWLVVME
jgi:phage gp29-like protein